MERYDYRKAMYNDIMEYITDEIGKLDLMTVEELEEIAGESEALYERFEDELWTADSVTGNASGSYTFNSWQAEENICHNIDLALEAYTEFGYDGIKDDSAESIDVTIRCYLLGEVLCQVCDTLADNAEALLACMGAENHDR